MKCGTRALVLSSVLAATSAWSVTDGSNPYERIVERNIFGLKSPPPPPDPEMLKTPPPKISLQGISTIFGKRKVLFKIQPSKPGDKEQSFILSEGQRDGEIEVLAINDKEGSIRFNNHGTVQTLSMEKDAVKPASTAAPAVAAARGIPRPGTPLPSPRSNVPPPTSGNSGVIQTGGLRQIPSRNLRTTPAPGGLANAGGGGVVQQGGGVPALSTEEQEIIIEANRAVAQQTGDPTAIILPPTDFGAALNAESAAQQQPNGPPGMPPPMPQY